MDPSAKRSSPPPQLDSTIGADPVLSARPRRNSAAPQISSLEPSIDHSTVVAPPSSSPPLSRTSRCNSVDIIRAPHTPPRLSMTLPPAVYATTSDTDQPQQPLTGMAGLIAKAGALLSNVFYYQPPSPAEAHPGSGTTASHSHSSTTTSSAIHTSTTSATIPMPKPVSDQPAAAASRRARVQPPNTEEITVAFGDTLEGLALRYDLHPSDLMKLNRMFARTLFPGQVLYVPAGGSTRAEAPSTQSSPVILERLHRQQEREESMEPSSVYNVKNVMCISDLGEVRGSVAVTPTQFFFQPDLDDPVVLAQGLGATSVMVDMLKISCCDLRPTQMADVKELLVIAHQDSDLVTYVFQMDDASAARMLKDTVSRWSKALQEAEDLKHVNLADFKPVVKEMTKEPIMTPEQYGKLRRALPSVFGQCDWVLLYSTAQHGISMNTFYRNVAEAGATLLVLEDLKGRIFGGMAPEAWRKSEKYYGMGETFVFTFHPTFELYELSGRNHTIMLSDDKFIALGGGGSFAFWLDSHFDHGTTRACSTYDNPPLTGQEEEFRCRRLEVYGFEM
eukprot:TRINITY_DN8765_c0_g1_i2.p1 TRINITY_DN8765_c0_g1~~TRINITY_DN8765_c0_g1_i2.p1  ORF type:complete len:561 (-),score=93.11 TRINITY_DN8765_c0_g1_i2:44-1726(-)